MSTNFAREFNLYESLFQDNKNSLQECVQLNEGFISAIKNTLSRIGDKVDDAVIKALTKQIYKSMETAEEPEETDLDDTENITIFKSDTNGNYIIKKENEPLVKKVNTLADAVWECDNTCAGWEIFIYILAVLKVPFQFYFEDDI